VSVDPIHEAPHASSDPAYCEMWAYMLSRRTAAQARKSI
jgi:hypothetical protein